MTTPIDNISVPDFLLSLGSIPDDTIIALAKAAARLHTDAGNQMQPEEVRHRLQEAYAAQCRLIVGLVAAADPNRECLALYYLTAYCQSASPRPKPA